MVKGKSEELKLKIELVPEISWFKSLREHIDRNDWDRIRKKTYGDYGHKCGICDAEGRLNCHEIWEYDDKKHVQKLVGFIALCDMCHHVKHIGLAKILADEGKLNYREVEAHFMKVNQCDLLTLVNHRARAFEQWEERSRHEWTIDLVQYKNVVK